MSDETVEYSDSTNLPTVSNTGVVRRSLFDLEPKQQVQKATEIANALTDVIEKQKLYSIIQGKKYVRVEGWELLGTFLGILPREGRVTTLEDGSYEATVELVRASDGRVVGGASALCGIDEKRWATAEKYARRSMAVTRATGKAYRLAFSWIVNLAGYEATPAEEMPTDYGVESKKRQNVQTNTVSQNVSGPAAETKAKVYTGETTQQEAVKQILKDKKVPEEKWSDVHNKLLGKPGKDLTKILQEMTHGTANGT